jgi:hypothetical protein
VSQKSPAWPLLLLRLRLRLRLLLLLPPLLLRRLLCAQAQGLVWSPLLPTPAWRAQVRRGRGMFFWGGGA